VLQGQSVIAIVVLAKSTNVTSSSSNLSSKDRIRVYDEYYSNVPIDSSSDRIFKSVSIRVHKCDMCNDALTGVPYDFNTRINIIDEIDDSFENEGDKSTYPAGPKLILCSYCCKEYLLPSYK
jgi:hypothetical protein